MKALTDILARAKGEITGTVELEDDKLIEFQRQLNYYQWNAIGYHEGEIGARARTAWDYYYKLLPKPIVEGSSQQVMPVVWNTVNGVLSELTSTFTSGEEVVKFAPQDSSDSIPALAATKMVNKILLHDNDGYKALHDCFKDALVSRNGFIKHYWNKHKYTVTEEFEDLTKDEFDAYLAGIEGDLAELNVHEAKSTKINEDGSEEQVSKLPDEKEQAPEEETFSGQVTYFKTKEGVEVCYVPFEEVMIEPTARSLCDANYMAHKVRKTKDELRQLGFNPEIVDGLDNGSSDWMMGVTENARVNYLNPLDLSETVRTGDQLTDRLWLHEHYIRSSLPNGRNELYQVFTVNDQILEVNVVNKIPFSTFTPFPIPGSIWGESIYDVTKDLQDLGSTALRAIIDNAMNANFRRYIAVKGQYDRQSLLNNRPGAVIEQMAAGSVDVFPYHQLPQGLDTILEYVSAEKEERTGISKVGQGLDASVFKNDNSTATTQMVMTAALNRVRMVARNIAHGGMTDMMLAIYDLVRQNGKEPIAVETAQGVMQVDPKQLPERNKMIVKQAIGAAEKAEHAQKLQVALMAFTQVPQMNAFLQAQGAYHLASEMLKSMGIYDVENYLTPPDKLPPPQPDPMHEAEVALAQEKVKYQQVETQKVVATITLDQQRHEFEQQKAADDTDIKKNESMSTQDRNADEMSLKEKQIMLEHERDLQRIQVEHDKNRLKQQEMLIEAQMENDQKRAVSIVG